MAEQAEDPGRQAFPAHDGFAGLQQRQLVARQPAPAQREQGPRDAGHATTARGRPAGQPQQQGRGMQPQHRDEGHHQVDRAPLAHHRAQDGVGAQRHQQRTGGQRQPRQPAQAIQFRQQAPLPGQAPRAFGDAAVQRGLRAVRFGQRGAVVHRAGLVFQRSDGLGQQDGAERGATEVVGGHAAVGGRRGRMTRAGGGGRGVRPAGPAAR
jgi:hypothetical protein